MSPEKKKGNWADSLTNLMEKMAPVFDQPILASVRDGFVALMPLIIVGALVLVVLQFPLCFQDEAYCYLRVFYPKIFPVRCGMFSVQHLACSPFCGHLSILCPCETARYGSADASIFAFMSYVLVTSYSANPVEFGEETFWFGRFFDNKGLFSAIVVSVITVEVFHLFVKRNIVIRCLMACPQRSPLHCRSHPWHCGCFWLVADPLRTQLRPGSWTVPGAWRCSAGCIHLRGGCHCGNFPRLPVDHGYPWRPDHRHRTGTGLAG